MSEPKPKLAFPYHNNLPQKKIQNYQFSFKSHIGSGSYGKVYYGEHIHTHLPVAIKVIQMELIENDEYMYNQLQNEISCMKNVQGEHIVKLLDVFLTKNNAYIIQEFCNRSDLRAGMREVKNEPFTEEKSLKILRDVVKGFQSLVAANIIHRDLKPENVLRNDDVYKLADFGFVIFLIDRVKIQRQNK